LLHRGTEKLIEHKTYLQAVPYFDRLDYVAPMNQEHAFALAVEKLLEASSRPLRAQYIRVLFSELGRVINHILNLTTYALDVGALHARALGFRRAREGHGILRTRLRRPLARELFPSGRRASGSACRVLPKICTNGADQSPFRGMIVDMESLLTENRIFKQRTVDIGIVSKSQALDWGFTGPMLRASGVPWDLRKSQPYDCYARNRFRHSDRHRRAIAMRVIWCGSKKCASRRRS
jgi:NADH-quinone oxidoreductase subunit D